MAAAWRPKAAARTKRPRSKSTRALCLSKKSKCARRVREGDLFLVAVVAGSPHAPSAASASRCPAENLLFSSLTLLMAAAGGRVAAAWRQKAAANEASEFYFSSLAHLTACSAAHNLPSGSKFPVRLYYYVYSHATAQLLIDRKWGGSPRNTDQKR